MFSEGWAHHKLRTERNRTPKQLLILGMQSCAEEDDSIITGLNVSID